MDQAVGKIWDWSNEENEGLFSVAQEICAENPDIDTGARLLPNPIQLIFFPFKCKGNPYHIKVRHFPHPLDIGYRGAQYP
jgi:hypothetical protein